MSLYPLRDGACHAAGPPAQIITEQLIQAVFDTPCRPIEDPITGTPLCLTISARHTPRAEQLS